MAFLGIGKKSVKPVAASASAATDSGGSGFGDSVGGSGGSPAVATPAKSGKKGLFAAKAKSAPAAKSQAGKPKARAVGGDLDIYTAVLVAAVLALAAGCVFVALDNLAGVEGTSDAGNPFVVLSSR